jgi:hypothetical protein
MPRLVQVCDLTKAGAAKNGNYVLEPLTRLSDRRQRALQAKVVLPGKNAHARRARDQFCAVGDDHLCKHQAGADDWLAAARRNFGRPSTTGREVG